MLSNLRAAIELRFGTQLAFARAVGIGATTLNRIINGWREPTFTEGNRIAQALDADPEWLFRRFISIPRPAASVGSDPLPVSCAAKER